MFDLVHDSQAVHRALVLAFSFPGTPVPLEVSVPDLGLEPTLVAVALTLLDQETSFAGGNEALAAYTGARRVAIEDADFVFATASPWDQAFERARRGTLADPQGGATVVGFAPSTQTTPWVLTGPGLEKPTTVRLPSGTWVETRNRACVEFPLGVDLVWVQEGGVVGLPRSTRLTPGGL